MVGRIGAVVLIISIFTFFNATLVEAQPEDNNFYTIEIYDYNTGEFLGASTTYAPSWLSENPEFENMPHGIYAWDDFGAIGITTTSNALEIGLDTSNNAIYVQISGQSGTEGKLNLFVTPTLLPSPEDVEVYMDNLPLEFTVEKLPGGGGHSLSYIIRMRYTHSTYTLAFVFTPEVSQVWYTQPLNLALLASAVVIAIGAAYWFKSRG